MSIEHRITPNGNRVLARVLPPEEKTKSGLIIPEEYRERAKTYSAGVVLAVGPGERDLSGTLIPSGFEVGQTIIFAKFGGFQINLDGTDCVLLEGREILGTVLAVN